MANAAAGHNMAQAAVADATVAGAGILVSAPPGTTWGPAAKARVLPRVDGAAATIGDRVTGAANMAKTFAARAQVIAADLLPVRPAEPSDRVSGAMDAFVTRSAGPSSGPSEGCAGKSAPLAGVHVRLSLLPSLTQPP